MVCAAAMLAKFAKHWERCKDDPEAAHELISFIVERVYVEDEKVVALTLKADLSSSSGKQHKRVSRNIG
jgi:hypothetical protein